MKTTKLMLVLLAVLMLLAFMGCGKNKVKTDGELVNFPPWWNVQADEAYVCTYGMATKVSQTASMDAAKANALLEAAQFVETEVKGMIKNFESETGVFEPQILALTEKVVKVISSAKFSGVIPGRTETRKVTEYGGPRFTTYIQMKIPKTEVRKNLYNNIRNEEALYNEFKATKAFEELDYSTKK
ncbi:MAG: hypothetical protein Q8M98_04410 [Candidatus Cloacimonadaceae bacterium]|nr:hypothetical protein [Candidatus Cloacimonadaceae bacterium]